MGELINLNPSSIGIIPDEIARDTEVASAIANHASAADPHPNLWTRITNTFLSLTGGQRITKNNPTMSAISYNTTQNSLELMTSNGSNPIIGFHRGGFSATALYHLGYGNDSLRIINADGFDGAILHDGNIGTKTAATAKADDGTTILRNKILRGTTNAVQGLSTTIPHGLNIANIVSVQVIVKVDNIVIVPDAFQDREGRGLRFSWVINWGLLSVQNVPNESAGILSKQFLALITYLD